MRCKIGDLAFVVAPRVSSNLGLLVEVIAVWPNLPDAWLVRSLCGPRKRTNGTVAQEGMARDSWLRPLKGDLDGRSDHRISKAHSSSRRSTESAPAIHG